MPNAICDDLVDGVSFLESTVSSTSDSASESDENSSIGLDARKSNQNCATTLVIPDEISVMECKVGSTSTSVAVVNDSTEDLNDNNNPPTSDLREKISVIDIELDGASNDKFSSNICSDNNPVKNNSSCDSDKHTSQENLHQNTCAQKEKKVYVHEGYGYNDPEDRCLYDHLQAKIEDKDVNVILHGKMNCEPMKIDGNTDNNDNKYTLDKSNHKIYDSDPDEDEDEERKERKHSLIHNDVYNGKVIFISFDIETGGDDCGIVQLSAECFTVGSNVDEDCGKRLEPTFNSYVKPHEDAIWSKYATEIHGLHQNHPSIIHANPLHLVWEKFVSFIGNMVPIGFKGVLVAWNGETCDMEWCYRLMNGPNASISFPRQIRYFMDPLEVIRRHTGCKFHPNKSKLQSLSLGSVYRYINEKDLAGAHNSLIDAKAQTDIVLHHHFKGYWDKKYSVRTISSMWKKKTIRKANQKAEVNWPVPDAWKTGVNIASWAPSFSNSYEGPSGGPDIYGPSYTIKEVCRVSDCISCIFFVLFPITLFGYIAEMSEKYAFIDWVAPNEGVDCDGNKSRKKKLKPCESTDPNKRRRAHYEYHFTTGYIISWIGILIYYGSLGTTKSPQNFWIAMPYGIYAPWVQNTMTRDAFKECRRLIHLSGDIHVRHRVTSQYDPLAKVRYVLDKLMTSIRNGWIAGKRITVDESMIKYCGRAVYFIQYMPKKPIKHGIKVFALCCAYTGYLLNFEVYLGKDTDTNENTALHVVDRLINKANLIHLKGRILYADNWYTTTKLAKFLYETYRWLFVGTVVTKDSKERTENSIPFRKLSNGALKKVKRGWMRKATLPVVMKNNEKYHLQCTTWKDKKQVTFLHTHLVQNDGDTTVKRHVKGNRQRIDLNAPPIQPDYSKYFNAVDVNDHDSADYTVSIRTNRWYLRIFLWLVDRVIFACYLIVCHSNKPMWSKYKSKNDGRRKFQIDLALAVMEYGIKLDWKEPYDDKDRPKWMRQKAFVPCACKKCFFCKMNKTNGMEHKPKSRVEAKRKRDEKVCTIDRVDLGRGCSYCRPCYRNHSNTSETHSERRKACSSTRLGCKGCDEFVCAKCWKSYEHNS